MNKWISVDDRMPEADKRVLVYDSLHGEITIGEAPIGEDGLWGVAEGFDPYAPFPSTTSSFITHWMPLPGLPG